MANQPDIVVVQAEEVPWAERSAREDVEGEGNMVPFFVCGCVCLCAFCCFMYVIHFYTLSELLLPNTLF